LIFLLLKKATSGSPFLYPYKTADDQTPLSGKSTPRQLLHFFQPALTLFIIGADHRAKVVGAAVFYADKTKDGAA